MSRPNHICYPVLKAEMRKRYIRISDIAVILHRHRDSVSDNLSGKTPLLLKDAFVIQKKFFPNLSIETLFEKKEAGIKARSSGQTI